MPPPASLICVHQRCPPYAEFSRTSSVQTSSERGSRTKPRSSRFKRKVVVRADNARTFRRIGEGHELTCGEDGRLRPVQIGAEPLGRIERREARFLQPGQRLAVLRLRVDDSHGTVRTGHKSLLSAGRRSNAMRKRFHHRGRRAHSGFEPPRHEVHEESFRKNSFVTFATLRFRISATSVMNFLSLAYLAGRGCAGDSGTSRRRNRCA